MRKTEINDIIDEFLRNIEEYNKKGVDNSILHKSIKDDLNKINNALSTSYVLGLYHYYPIGRTGIDTEAVQTNKPKLKFMIAGLDIYTQLFLQGLEEYCIGFENLSTCTKSENTILNANGDFHSDKLLNKHEKFIFNKYTNLHHSATMIMENDKVSIYCYRDLGKSFIVELK